MNKALMWGFLFGGIISGAYGAESDGIFSWKVGNIEVYTLVESQRVGNAGILAGATPELLARYVPESGFIQSTNAFLLKTPKLNIVVDTGTGQGGILIEKIKKLGVAPEQVNAVLITHLHGDHFGSLQKTGKAAFPNATVYLSARERDFFTKSNVNQGARAALAAYGSNVKTFEPSELGSKLQELLPGISPVASYGHTPGHTSFLLEDGGARLLIAGDFLHASVVQFPNPGISATYDMDANGAVAARRQIMDYAAKQKIPVAGMHIPYPAVGTVEAAGNGYRFIPAQ